MKIMNPSHRKPDTTVSLVRFELWRTCMKKSTTAVPLSTAMPNATMSLSGPRLNFATTTVTKVMTIRKPKVRKYGLREGACGCVSSSAISSLPRAYSVRPDQVEQREQEDPDDVHEVPVQPDALQGVVPLGGEAPAPGRHQQVAQQPDADHHVQGVQAGHTEVEREEDLGLLGVARLAGRAGIVEARARHQVVLGEVSQRVDAERHPLLAVLDGLDAEEGEAERHGD